MEVVIEILSPVHIGCDEVYEPTGFVVDEANSRMTAFNPISFVGSLEPSEKQRFSAICAKGSIGSILEIYQFMRGRQAEGRQIRVCPGFVDTYERTLRLQPGNEKRIKQELNSFLIPRTSFCPSDERCYIPGSAVKGAVRTAYLNLMQARNPSGRRYNMKAEPQLQKDLIGFSGIPDDPFRLVKVSDFMPVGDVKTAVVFCVNEKKQASNTGARGIPQLLEIIEPGSLFRGTISVTDPPEGSGIRRPVTMEALLEGIRMFFKKEKQREDGELARIGIIPFAIPPSEEGWLLRCGRHSGAESITVEGHRSIMIMGKKNTDKKFLSGATTVWLTSPVSRPKLKSSLLPMGWVRLEKISSEMERDLLDAEADYQENLLLGYRETLIAIELKEKDERKARELEEQRLKEEEQRREEEEKRQAELEALPPEERAIAEVFGNSSLITENDVVELYLKLDTLPEEARLKAAEEMKAYWAAQGKWDVKKKQKKQFEKVRKLKSILGEN